MQGLSFENAAKKSLPVASHGKTQLLIPLQLSQKNQQFSKTAAERVTHQEKVK